MSNTAKEVLIQYLVTLLHWKPNAEIVQKCIFISKHDLPDPCAERATAVLISTLGVKMLASSVLLGHSPSPYFKTFSHGLALSAQVN